MISFREFLRIWLLISLATLLARLLLNPAPAQAEEPWHHAGLIVRDGDGRLTYAWVPFTEEEIDGIALLKRSGIPVVTVGFGALGEGVCAIAGAGCGVSECRRTVCQVSGANAPYWQFFQQDPDDPASWRWLALGGSATRVRNGDTFGWSWTGQDPQLPAVTATELAQLAGAGDGAGDVASFRTYLPEGVSPLSVTTPPDTRTLAAGLTGLGAIGLAGLALVQRARRGCARARLLPWDDTEPAPARPLDPRAWLLWAAAASVAPLLGRNPWPIVATLLAVLSVWTVWSTGAAGRRWRPLLRLALVFSVIGVVFNVLTVRAGDVIIGRLPTSWPIIGGALTLNALVFGLLSALAIFTLVGISATLGVTLDWTLIIRLLPERMAPLAVAGSVAWAYLPRTTAALGEIREAQMARGFRPRGARDALPLLMPLLGGGLERAMVTAEALEARAFGAPLAPEAEIHPWRAVTLLLGLAGSATGAYVLALGWPALGSATLAVGALLIVVSVARRPAAASARRTRYREPVWERAEWLVTGSALLILVVQAALLAGDPGAFRYEPYPSIGIPPVNLPLLVATGLLLVPAAVPPA
ncbi:MAG: energy-coupling factor transporter transmembrane protein EcfT [Thermomicrobiales bacterium]|nr:energy-coupling factor transporter transmembrane protein EcfT [Thermomicrobiales bacterium]